MKTGSALCVIAACLTSTMAGAATPSPDQGSAVESAIADHNLRAAGLALNALVQARLPAKEANHSDPLLDRLFVDYNAATGKLPAASAVLPRVIDNPATPDPDHYRLLRATYEESVGELAAAEQQYRELAGNPKARPENGISAALGLARLQMAANPDAALQTLQSIDPKSVPATMAWEVDLLIERAATMAGPANAAIASAAMERAWSEAPNASVVDGAVARVAADRAIAAGRTGDRKSLVAMLAVDRTSRGPNNGQAGVVADLPICGTNGITPQDTVIIEAAHQPAIGRPPVTLAWASRPGIAAPFLIAATRSGMLTVSDGQAATFALKCRTAPSTEFAVRNSIEESIAGWMTERGAYPFVKMDDGTSPSSLASMLAQREAKYGANSMMLLPLLFRTMQGGITEFGDTDSRKQMVETANRIAAILDQNKAPASLSLIWKLSSIGMAVAAQTKAPDVGQSEAQALLLKAASDSEISLDTIYMLALDSTQMPNTPTSFKSAMLGATLDLLKRQAPAGDQRTAAIALRLYQLRASLGDEAGAQAAIKPAGMPGDLCDLSDPPTRIVSSNITSDDYPGDLVFMTMPGLTYVEFDLDEAGSARNGRLLFSDPPFAFDQIAMSRVPTIHYDPARSGGKPYACRGEAQAIRWQMPY